MYTVIPFVKIIIVLQCTNGKWFIDNKYYEEIQPICKPNEENEPMFFMSLPDQPEKELKEGQCFEKCIWINLR